MKAASAARQLARHMEYKLRPQKTVASFKCTSYFFSFIGWRDVMQNLHGAVSAPTCQHHAGYRSRQKVLQQGLCCGSDLHSIYSSLLGNLGFPSYSLRTSFPFLNLATFFWARFLNGFGAVVAFSLWASFFINKYNLGLTALTDFGVD